MHTRTKNLGLAGVFLGASILSGCSMNDNSILGAGLSALGVRKGNAMAQVVGGQLANYGANQAGASNTNVYVSQTPFYNPTPFGRPGFQQPLNAQFIAPRWEIFSCSSFRDLNNDGSIDPSTDEIIDKGKTEFYVGDNYAYFISINNSYGRELGFYVQTTPGGPHAEVNKHIIPRNNHFAAAQNTFKEPGDFHSYWTFNGQIIGENRVSVRPKQQVANK